MSIVLTRYCSFQTFHASVFSSWYSTKAGENALSGIPFDKIDQLVQKELEITEQFHKQGYLVLSAPTSDETLLSSVARLFGKIQSHVRSPKHGIVEIHNELSDAQNKQINSNFHFFAHTDGAYLEGMMRQGNKIFRIVPPKIIALQCVKPSSEGGISFLIDGKKILLHMIKNHPHLLTTLFSRSCTSICRESHLVMDLPIFKKLPSGNFSVRFSYDQDLHTPKWAIKDLAFFNQHYILNPGFITFCPLLEKQILVLDNHRYLHGRTEIQGNRLFRRIWVQDEKLSMEMYTPPKDDMPYFGSSENSARALNQYQPYGALNDLEEGFKYKNISVGIELSAKIRTKIEHIIRKDI